MTSLCVKTCGTVLPLLLAMPVCAGVNSFTHTGPEGGHTLAVAVQPGHPEVLLASSLRGLHRSTDAGATWNDVTGGRYTSRFIAFDPSTPTRAFFLSDQVYRSTDSGQTFTATTQYGAGEAPYAMSLAQSYIFTVTLAGVVRRSSDGGNTWTQLTTPWSAQNSQIQTIAAAPGNAAVVYTCVHAQGSFKSVDHGATWTSLGAGSPCSTQWNFARHFAVSPADPDRVVASTSDGMFLTVNGGATWSQVVPTPFLQWVTFDPAAPDNLVSVDPGGSIRRSFDGGVTWPFAMGGTNLYLYQTEMAIFTGTAGHLWLATPDGPMFSGDNGLSVTLRPNGIRATDVREVIAADDGTIYSMQFSGRTGIYRRAGGSWERLDTDEVRAMRQWPLDLMDISTSAQDPSLLYLADQGGGLYRSNNGGLDWVGPPATILGQTFAITVDPTNALVAYAARASGGLLRTQDGGQTFAACGLDNTIAIRKMVVDRSAPATVYAVSSYGPTRRVFKSANACQSWVELPSPGVYVEDLVIDPIDNRKIYLAYLGGVDITRDGGATWQPMTFNTGAGTTALGRRLLIDPIHSDTIWSFNDFAPGAARSVDGGVSWQLLPATGFNHFLHNGVLDPLNPDTLVAGARAFGMVEYTVALDLGVTVTTPGRLTNGATGAVSVRVTNHGALDASPASLTVTLPSHVELVTLPPECVRATGNLQCTTSVIRAGESVSMALTLRATAPGMASMNVTVVGHESDPVASNNSASGALTGPREADVDVIEPAAADSNLGRTSSRTLEFTVVNRGPEAAENTLVRFALASGFTIEEALASTGTCVVAGQQVSCSFLSLGVDMPVPVRLRVLANVAGQQHVDFDASSDAFDGNTNQQGRATFNVLPMSDVSVEVSASSASLTTGSAYSYNATVRNAGPDAARPVVNFSMTGAALSQVTSGGGVCVLVAPSQASCQLIDIPSGGSATISLNASAAAAGTATLASEVAVPGSLDPLRANGSATTSTAVTAPPGAGAGAGGAKSGGGGRFDWWLLAALGLLAPLRRPRATSWSRG